MAQSSSGGFIASERKVKRLIGTLPARQTLGKTVRQLSRPGERNWCLALALVLVAGAVLLQVLLVRTGWLAGLAVPAAQFLMTLTVVLLCLKIIVARHHMRSAAALKESEERFRLAFGHAPTGMALLTPDLRVIQVNEALCAMLGYSEQELKQMSPMDIVHPEDREPQPSQQQILTVEGSVQFEKRFIHRNGHFIWVLGAVSLVRSEAGQPPLAVIVHVQDNTERRNYEQRLQHWAHHDALTGLTNRRGFELQLTERLAEANRDGGQLALLFLDLDGFKDINDALGHPVGDQVLSGLAPSLKENVRSSDLVARIGGDEFAILLSNADSGRAEDVAARILGRLRSHVVQGDERPFAVTASIGIALFPEHGRTAKQLLAHADRALYQAKIEGRNSYTVIAPEQVRGERSLSPGLTWQERISRALANHDFFLEWQPIVDLRTGAVNYYEVLLRMRTDDGAVLPAAVFINPAERARMVEQIDQWVLAEVLQILRAGAEGELRVRLAVNVSNMSMADPSLLHRLQEELDRSDIDPSRLIVEISEAAVTADPHQAQQFTTALKALGCRFAVDEFGFGFSSFSLLKHLPADYLKIDSGLTGNLLHDEVDQKLVQAIVHLAHSMDKQVIACYVGDAATLELLKKLGVDYAQGFFLGKPQPVADRYPDERKL